ALAVGIGAADIAALFRRILGILVVGGSVLQVFRIGFCSLRRATGPIIFGRRCDVLVGLLGFFRSGSGVLGVLEGRLCFGRTRIDRDNFRRSIRGRGGGGGGEVLGGGIAKRCFLWPLHLRQFLIGGFKGRAEVIPKDIEQRGANPALNGPLARWVDHHEHAEIHLPRLTSGGGCGQRSSRQNFDITCDIIGNGRV